MMIERVIFYIYEQIRQLTEANAMKAEHMTALQQKIDHLLS